MLHEVLMALVGYSGDFLPKVLECDTILDPAEGMLIKKVLNIASEYTALKKFIDNNICIIGLERNSLGNQNDQEMSARPFGIYLQAFCNGLKEVLLPYHAAINGIEEEALKDPYLPLLTVISKIEGYAKVFEVLNSVVKQITEQNIHGCQILDFLHREMAANVDNVQEALQSIIHCCHMVFFKQLSSWLLYGQLIDRYSEFFIQPISATMEDQDQEGAVVGPSVSESFSSQDTNGVLDMNSGSFQGSYHKYAIQYHLLPSYIVPSLAQKILFIGETIVVFGCDPKEKDELQTKSRCLTSIWGEREVEFHRKLQKLQAMKVFNRTEFEKTMEELRSCVTQHLWKLAVEEAELFGQIQLMKDFFLLGRGELFLEFIRQASPVLCNAPVGTSTRDVNQAFHLAVRKILVNDDVIDKFIFSLPSKSELKQEAEKKDKNIKEFGMKENCWHLLKLTYKVSWPLHLLFDETVLSNYNKLFCFLLHVKKTQLDLHNVWKNHMEQKKVNKTDVEPIVWHLRNRLMFLIDNLQYYLQVDVLESQYAILQTAIQTTTDFEQIQKAHTLFQANIMSQTYLLSEEGPDASDNPEENLNPVQKVLTKILSLCERFCVNVNKWTTGIDLNEAQCTELDTIVMEYECLAKYLLQLLISLSLHTCGSHLSQLLLRLDFNRWFSTENKVTSP